MNQTHPYGATNTPRTATPTHRGDGAALGAPQTPGRVIGHAA